MAFPTTGVLDNFNRANENPLANGNWSGPVGVGRSQLQLVSNQAASGTGASDSYWSAKTFGPNSEVFSTIAVLPTLAQFNGLLFYIRLINPNTSSVSGYRINAFMDVNPFPLDQYEYSRMDNGVNTVLGADVTGPTLAAGDKFGANMVGSQLIMFTKQGAGAWTALDGGRTDTTYAGVGNIAMRIDEDGTNPSTQREDDFGGGTVSKVVPRSLALLGVGS